MTVDAKGTPFAGGGLSAGLRDLGRVGLLMLNGGELNGKRLFPKKVVDTIRSGGDKAAFEKAGYMTLVPACSSAYEDRWRWRDCEHQLDGWPE